MEQFVFFRKEYSTKYRPLAANDRSISQCESLEHYGNESASTLTTTEAKVGKSKLDNKSNRTRRGWGTIKNKETSFSIIGNNSNGIKAKRDSLLNVIRKFGSPSCVIIQETKLRFPGTFKIPGYQIFEKTRMGQGGGLLTAIDCNLSPLLVSSELNETEILVVQAQVGKHSIRVMNAYGPQETESKEKIYEFWEELEKEVIDSKEKNHMMICF